MNRGAAALRHDSRKKSNDPLCACWSAGAVIALIILLCEMLQDFGLVGRAKLLSSADLF
ncbi:MAG: hypothetical protein SNJ57_05300 [Cyanobacteriota bacterium]